jgi:hypothetical protein
MAGLKISEAGLRDLALFKSYAAKEAGADGLDLRLSAESGMDARDIMNLRRFTREMDLLIVFRCPKASARAFHGTLPAKTFATKEKTNETGTVFGRYGDIMVSDYDMMSLWLHAGTGFQHIYVSALEPGAPRGPWSKEAVLLVKAMNEFLITKLQHGCQDDWHSPGNPGVKMTDHFLAVRMGDGIYLRDPNYCENFYAAHGLFWPYGAGGKHCGHGPAGKIGP